VDVGDGDRVAKGENGVATSYVVAILGLSHVLVETTGGQVTRYVYGHDLLAEHDGEAWAWHLNDGLGSARSGQLADGNGDVTLAQGYTPFGVPLWSEGSGATGYGFTGERWEAYSALVFLRARYYEPATGRFISRDTSPGNSLNPRTHPGWVYVENNPIQYIDPTGFQAQQSPFGEIRDKAAEWLLDKADTCYQAGDLRCVWWCYWAVANGGALAGYPYASLHLNVFLYKLGDLQYSPRGSSWVSSSPSVQRGLPRLLADLLKVVQVEAKSGAVSGRARTKPLPIAADPSQEKDLYYAMFRFQLWMESDFEVAHCDGCQYEVRLDSEYHFHDDFDWHKGLAAGGAAIGVKGFKDEWAAALHDHGLAHEFKIDGYWFDQPRVRIYTFPDDWLTSSITSSPIAMKSGRH